MPSASELRRPARGRRALIRGWIAAGVLCVLTPAGARCAGRGMAPAEAPPPPPAIIDALSPGQGISGSNSQVSVPVTVSRTDSTAVRGFHIEFTLTGLALPGGVGSVVEGTFLNSVPGAQTVFEVSDDGGGAYSVDGAILGQPCGQTATAGTLFTLTLGAPPGDGTGSVRIQAASLRDCANASLAAQPGDEATVIIDRTPPEVTVDSPGDGDEWVVGSPQVIQWEATDASGVTLVNIAYSVDSGATYPYTIASAVPNTGSYQWTVPNTPTDHAKVRVTALDAYLNSASATSASTFTIDYIVLSAFAGPGGKITPSGSTPAIYGSNVSYAITPDSGYSIQSVNVDEAPVGAVPAYTFNFVTTSHVIQASFAPIPPTPKGIFAYPTPASVAPGDSISFHVSSDFSPIDVRIYRYDSQLIELQRFTSIPAQHYATPDSAYALGCNWPVTLALRVPTTWPGGVYLALFIDSGKKTYSYAIFVVRTAAPGAYSKTLYVVPYATYEAYNAFGGNSLYDFSTRGVLHSPRVSLERPISYNNGAGAFDAAEGPFTSWYVKNGFIAEYCSNLDLAQNPGLLNNYRLVIIPGHHEYWTKEERDAFDAFRDRGGRIALFNANCAYWQVRLENGGRTIVCYKDSLPDPLYHTDPARTTVRFRDPPVNRPEATLLGAMYGNNSNGYGRSIVVADPTGWIFNGTGLNPGDALGTNLVGGEWDDSSPFNPPGTRILFNTPTAPPGRPPGHSVASYYETTSGWGSGVAKGARVFDAGTIQWCLGLDSAFAARPVWQIQRVTRNLLQGLCQFDSSNRVTQLTFRLNLRGLHLQAGAPVQVAVPGAGTSPAISANMVDDGVSPDSAAGDSVYTCTLTLPPGTPKPSPVQYTFVYSPNTPSAWSSSFTIIDSAGAAAVQLLGVERPVASLGLTGTGPDTPFRLRALGPNPFGRRTEIEYSVDRALAAAHAAVRVEVCDVEGRLVQVLRDGPVSAGVGLLTWDGRGRNGHAVPSGIYYVRMRGGAEQSKVRLLRVR